MKRLTDLAVRAAVNRSRRERFDLADGAVPGLTLRLGPHHATWSLVVRVTGDGGVTRRGHSKKGKRVRVTLGEYPKTTLEAARSLANAYLDQAKKGVSPARALEDSATAGGLTVKALSERFFSDFVQLGTVRVPEVRGGAARACRPSDRGRACRYVEPRASSRAPPQGHDPGSAEEWSS